MTNLLELITRTKGIEYLLALGFLFSFVGFWQWCRCAEEKKLITRVAPLATVSLIFAVLASTVIASPATATLGAQKSPSVDKSYYLANSYSSAKSAAHKMGPDVVACQTCHHHSSNGSTQPCSSCHNESVDANAADKPGLKAAYHQACADCHKEAFSGPMSCTKCHSESPEIATVKMGSPSPVTPPAMSHPLLDHSNCFACHAPEGQLPLPANHANYKTNVECLGCHKSQAGSLTASTVTLVQKDAQQTPAQPAARPAAPSAQQAPASVPATAAPVKVSHSVASRENCTACHQVGAGAKPMSSSHRGRTDSTCLTCHKAG